MTAIVLDRHPEEDARGKLFRDTVEVAASATLDLLPRPKCKDTAVVADAVKHMRVRGAVNERWGKKPIVEVTVTVSLKATAERHGRAAGAPMQDRNDRLKWR